MASELSQEAAALARQAQDVAARLSLLANPSRLLILCRLAQGEASVGTLQDLVGLSQSALSQHLARLREEGIVSTRREAQTIHYAIADAETRALMAALYDIFCRPRATAQEPREP